MKTYSQKKELLEIKTRVKKKSKFSIELLEYKVEIYTQRERQ